MSNDLRLSRIEYWLLTAVVTFRLPLDRLGADNVAMMLNTAPHGLDRPALAAAVHALCEAGWIAIDPTPLTTVAEVRAALEASRRSPPAYRLTAAGGAVWEAFARPDWSTYVEGIADVDDDGTYHNDVACADRDELERAVAPAVAAGAVVSFAEERPFAVTYWRTLPVGYRARFTDRGDGPSLRRWRWYWPV